MTVYAELITCNASSAVTTDTLTAGRCQASQDAHLPERSTSSSLGGHDLLLD
jgi:hypothetical protein